MRVEFKAKVLRVSEASSAEERGSVVDVVLIGDGPRRCSLKLPVADPVLQELHYGKVVRLIVEDVKGGLE